MDPTQVRAMAEHVFTRIVLSDLMVAECMRASDPMAAVQERESVKLGAADHLLDQRGDELSHAVLHELETFWRGVRAEVAERVQYGGTAS